MSGNNQNFKGKAIYTDVDMINFRDIKDLYETDLEGKPFGCKKGTRFGSHEVCVMLIDCEKAKEHLWPLEKLKKRRDNHKYFRTKIAQSNELVHEIDPRWNCFDGEGRQVEDIYQLHYTDMATQPWKPTWYQGKREKHKRQDLIEIFWKRKEEAVNEGLHPPLYEKKFGPYNFIGK